MKEEAHGCRGSGDGMQEDDCGGARARQKLP